MPWPAGDLDAGEEAGELLRQACRVVFTQPGGSSSGDDVGPGLT